MKPFWPTRSKRDAIAYWETRAAGYRGLIASMLASLSPFGSLLEVGCHSGPNLWAIRQQYPKAHLIGLEPSPACASFGQIAVVTEAMHHMSAAERDAFEQASQEKGEVPSVGIDFMVGQAPDGLSVFRDIDVVLSCYTLAYLTPDELDRALAEMVRIAQRGLLIVEPMPTVARPAGYEPGANVPYWRHDYEGRLGQVAPGWAVKGSAFPGPDGLNGAILARKV